MTPQEKSGLKLRAISEFNNYAETREGAYADGFPMDVICITETDLENILDSILPLIPNSDIQNKVDKLKEWLTEIVSDETGECDHIRLKEYGNEISETCEAVLNKISDLGL